MGKITGNLLIGYGYMINKRIFQYKFLQISAIPLYERFNAINYWIIREIRNAFNTSYRIIKCFEKYTLVKIYTVRHYMQHESLKGIIHPSTFV